MVSAESRDGVGEEGGEGRRRRRRKRSSGRGRKGRRMAEEMARRIRSRREEGRELVIASMGAPLIRYLLPVAKEGGPLEVGSW